MHLNLKVKAYIFFLLLTIFSVCVGICHTMGEETGGALVLRHYSYTQFLAFFGQNL